MPFNLNANVSVTRDDSGVVRGLEHLQQPFRSDTGLALSNPSRLGEDYLRSVADIYGFLPALISDLNAPISNIPTDDGPRLVFAEEKSSHLTITVSYYQTVLGLPIWESGFSVSVLPAPLRGTSSISSVKFCVEIDKPDRKSRLLNDVDPQLLAELLHLEDKEPQVHINSTRLLVYQYDPSSRQAGDHHQPSGPSLISNGDAMLPLPDVPSNIKPGKFYVVREALFTYRLPQTGDINWRVFIDVETSSVLYLRSFMASAKGYVYLHDPITTINGPLPTATDADLDPLRTLVILPGITPSSPQALAGDYVKIAELSPPVIPAPTESSGNFLFDVDTDGFAATNAYFHVESLFRLMSDLGFDLAKLFANTAQNPGFPLPVDQSGLGNQINAISLGNSAGNGSGGIVFGRAAGTGTVSIAADFRVVAHEFCHALLWDAVHSPNFGFSHSAGDSIGAILSDPGSEAPDPFVTFPWITLVNRRHDRDVTKGWAFGGTNDDKNSGYGAEQILSTTLFRAYLAIGGAATASVLSTWFETQTWASQYLVYLIVGGIASLATSPITPTPTADIYATAMMNSDAGIIGFDKQPGGAIRKVIRWSFEKQGLYQPAGAPTPVVSAGAPPDVDVYIDDGRSGEYQYLPVFWETTDIWNRLAADSGITHQTPIVNIPNYGYVRVKNRGTQTATNVVVSAYHVRPSSGLVWPDTYKPMTTASITVPSGIPSGGTVIVGPFQWTPTEIGHECMLMSVSALGDLSNIDPATSLPCAAGPLPDYRFVPFDNNIAQRNVAPVAGGGGAGGLVASLQGKQFWVNNPYDHIARAVIEIQLPAFLKRLGWKVDVRSEEGGAKFSLGSRAVRRLTIDVEAGGDFTAADVGVSPAMIRINTLINGIIVGGMSYLVDPTLLEPAKEHKGDPCDSRTGMVRKEAKGFLKCLGVDIPGDSVESVEISKITVEIDLRRKFPC